MENYSSKLSEKKKEILSEILATKINWAITKIADHMYICFTLIAFYNICSFM